MKLRSNKICVLSTVGFPMSGMAVISRPSGRKWWQFWKPKFIQEVRSYKIK